MEDLSPWQILRWLYGSPLNTQDFTHRPNNTKTEQYWDWAEGNCRTKIMAKSATILIKLVSTADTGFYYVTKKNPRNQTEKMEMRKYDPVVRKHVVFKESKIK